MGSLCVFQPLIISKACGKDSIITSKHSSTPFGLPGKLTIRQPDLIPAVVLLKIANGVRARVFILIASPIPGISISKIFFVASGVTSRGPSPVPPEVRIMSTSPPSDQSINFSEIRSAKIDFCRLSYNRYASYSLLGGLLAALGRERSSPRSRATFSVLLMSTSRVRRRSSPSGSVATRRYLPGREGSRCLRSDTNLGCGV